MAKGIGKDDLEHLFQIFMKGQPDKHSEQLDLYLQGNDSGKGSKKTVQQSKIAQYHFQIAKKKQLQLKRKRLKQLLTAYSRIISLEQKSKIATSNVVELEKINKLIEQNREANESRADFRLAFSYIAEADQVAKQLVKSLKIAEQALSEQYQDRSQIATIVNKSEFALPELETVRNSAYQYHADLLLKSEQLKLAEYIDDSIKVAGLTAYLAAAKDEVEIYIVELYEKLKQQDVLKSELRNGVDEQLEQRNTIYNQYDEGKKSWQDVLAVQKELVLKQLELASVEYSYKETSLMIAVEIGNFDESALIENHSTASTPTTTAVTANKVVQVTKEEIIVTDYDDELSEQQTDQVEQKVVEKTTLPTLLLGKLVLYNQPNSSKLTQNSQRRLEEYVAELLKQEDLKVQVSGYIASKNDTEENMKLSEKRAMNVKEMMLELGVNGDQIEAIGMSNRNPIASNNTRSGRSKNRRVEVNVIMD